MATTDKLKDVAEFLARELFKWKQFFDADDEDVKAGHYWGEKRADGYHYIFDWHPYSNTPEGLWQCLGKDGGMERMREKE